MKDEKRAQDKSVPLLTFARQFLTHPKHTGALVPSSDRLAELICESAQLSTAKVIVELGPGTGVFTEHIKRYIAQDALFFAIEKNKAFVQETRRRCPQVKVFHGGADQLGFFLKAKGVDHADRIVCGLPWANFSEEVQITIMREILKALAPKGIFVTFAYLHGRFLPTGLKFRKFLEDHFAKVSTTDLLWTNIPPAFVYVAKKK